jgi:hypothetical protein
MDESPDIDDDAEKVAPEAPAEPPKRRGRPKGLGKVPGSGRQALPRTPADLRAYMVEQIGKADRLLDIAQGKQIHLSGPSGKTYLGYPSISDQLAAWRLILGKCLPDLQSVATTLDANVSAEVKAPELASPRDLARAILGILSTASLEKVPHRGEYIEADTGDDTDDESSGELAIGGSPESAGGVQPPPSASANAALGQPFPAARSEEDGRVGHAAHPSSSPKDPALMSQAELRAELVRQGVLPADGPIGVPHNPWAMKGEMPPAMSAEDRIAERAKEQGRHPLSGARRTDWMDDIAGATDGPHQRRPNADPDFEPSGLAKKHFVGERGHYFEFCETNNDGRRKYWVRDASGLRVAPAWGREAAETKIHELLEQGGQAVAKQKWQRS